jgi:hypothetical protein
MKINAEKSANAKEVDIKVKTLRMVLNRTPPPWSGGETVCDQSTLMPYSYISIILHNYSKLFKKVKSKMADAEQL